MEENKVVEEPKKVVKKTSNAKKPAAAKKPATKKTSTSATKKAAPKKEIDNPLDKPVLSKKASGASSIEKALASKKVDSTESSETNNSKDDMKARMQRIINASKKLNDSILDEDTKKAQMKEKLANAAQEMEEEYGSEVKEESLADSYSEKNAQLSGKYADLSKKLAAMMAESGAEFEDDYEDEVEERKVEEPVMVEETKVEEPVMVEETKVEEPVMVEETKAEEPVIVEETKVEEPVMVEETKVEEPVIVEETKVEEPVMVEETKVEEPVMVEETKVEEPVVVEETKVEEPVKLEEVVEEKAEPEIQEVAKADVQVPKKTIFKKILDYVIKTMNGMAFGLFATLIIGTIIGTIGGFFTDGSTANTLLTELATLLKNMTGLGIGVGIAWSLKYDGIKLISIATAGAIAAYFCYENFGFKTGDPLSIYIVVIITSLLLDQIFRKKTPVDIIIIPLFTALFSSALTILISEYIVAITSGLSKFIGVATEYQPILMGIVISVVMGMALTAPISSAAIAAIIFVMGSTENGLLIASGAALIGCCTQMVGFAVMSRKDNNIGTCIAIGVGTSMLQFKNILKKPIIWLPTIIVSAILGPIATTLIELKCMGTAAGMGTSGLVGMIGTFESMGSTLDVWMIVIGFEILLPAALVFIVDLIFRKFDLIKEGDLKL